MQTILQGAYWSSSVLVAVATLGVLAGMAVLGVSGAAELSLAMAFYFLFMGCIRRVPGGATPMQRALFRMTYWFPLILPVVLIPELRQELVQTLAPTPTTLALGTIVGLFMSIIFLYPSRQLFLDRTICMLAVPPMQRSDLLLSAQSMIGAAVFEEALFRYAVFALIGQSALALVVSTLLFVVAHYSLPWATQTFSRRDYLNQAATGVIIGGLFWATGSLLACILAHMIFNVLRLGPAVLRSSIYGEKNELYES